LGEFDLIWEFFFFKNLFFALSALPKKRRDFASALDFGYHFSLKCVLCGFVPLAQV
jgi:hypothetical protein